MVVSTHTSRPPGPVGFVGLLSLLFLLACSESSESGVGGSDGHGTVSDPGTAPTTDPATDPGTDPEEADGGSAGAYSSVTSLLDFKSLGPGGGGGIYSAVFHNTDPDVILVGQDVGGVYKSADGGVSWRHVNQGGISHPALNFSAYVAQGLFAHPTQDEVFFAATGQAVSC